MAASSSDNTDREPHDQGSNQGQPADQLLPLVYDELRALAARHMRNQRSDHTLEPTALVHEAYMRLAKQPGALWKNRGQFLAVAAVAIRSVLVDYARGHDAAKRGRDWFKIPLEEIDLPFEERYTDMIALDEALRKLAEFNPRQSRIVELRFFGGMSIEETAEVMGISTPTVERDWRAARARLLRELQEDKPNEA